jgi:Ca-activated chloride channel family protein
VLVTDGYIDAEADVFDYIRKQLHETNFFAFGIGSSVNRYLIEGVAHAGLGEPFIVTRVDQSEAAAKRFRHYIDSPVLAEIKVNFAGFDAYDVEPKNIPDLFASRPIVLIGKWRGSPGGSIEITGRTGRDRYSAVLSVAESKSDPAHAALRLLWARTRIANLSDFGPSAASEDTVGEITALGLKYGLLTRYTSFVAVSEIVRHNGPAEEVDQPLPMPAGVSDLAVGVTGGPEPELIWPLLIAALLISWLSLRQSRRRNRGGVA